MSSIEDAIKTIRRVADKLGAPELSRLSGVPYVTVLDARKRDFKGRAVETLDKLARFAEAYEREHGDGAADERAA